MSLLKSLFRPPNAFLLIFTSLYIIFLYVPCPSFISGLLLGFFALSFIDRVIWESNQAIRSAQELPQSTPAPPLTAATEKSPDGPKTLPISPPPGPALALPKQNLPGSVAWYVVAKFAAQSLASLVPIRFYVSPKASQEACRRADARGRLPAARPRLGASRPDVRSQGYYLGAPDPVSRLAVLIVGALLWELVNRARGRGRAFGWQVIPVLLMFAL